MNLRAYLGVVLAVGTVGLGGCIAPPPIPAQGTDTAEVGPEFSQVIDCVEPYLVVRQFPRGYGFGINLRVDNLVEVIRRRQGIKQRHEADERKHSA